MHLLSHFLTKLLLVASLMLFISPQLQAMSWQTCEDIKIYPIKEINKMRYKVTEKGDKVIDKTLGLTWRRCALGQYGPECAYRPMPHIFREAFEAVDSTNQTESEKWRLPTSKELLSLQGLYCKKPDLAADLFPNSEPGYYWGYSSYARGNYHQWKFYLAGECQDCLNPYNAGYVRLVKTSKEYYLPQGDYTEKRGDYAPQSNASK